MTRVHVVAEGQTEEEFVNSVLVPHFAPEGFYLDVRCVETSRRGARIIRGGLLDYDRAKRDLERWMKEDDHPDCFFTTMFDLFRLPREFPGFEQARTCRDLYKRVQMLEDAMAADLGHQRFVPYIQLHEFEALILSEPRQLAHAFLARDSEIGQLADMAAGFDSPERIDDGPETAPSKRIIALIPEYEGRKASAGPLTAGKIGLPTLTAKCRHFAGWIERIRSLHAPGTKTSET